MSMTPYAQTTLIKQAIINAFAAQQGASGKLASVLAIGPTAFPEANAYPYIGVDIVKTKEEFIGNHHMRISIDFGISCSVKSITLLQDAYTQRDVILDDGNGNGYQPILRNMMYTLLGGLITKCEIGDTIFLSNVSQDKLAAPTEFYADAVTMFHVWQTINI